MWRGGVLGVFGISLSGLVIVECKNSTELYFNKLQEVIVFEIGLQILPVTCTDEAARIIVNIVSHYNL